MLKYPIMTITGDFGAGKTLYLTYLGLKFYQDGLTIYSNYDLYGIDYEKITFKDLADMPSWLTNGVILLDEGHIGMDAYNFLQKKVQNISTFITQIRKNNLILAITTQRFNTLAKRVRELINYYIEIEKVIVEDENENLKEMKGWVKVKVFDITDKMILVKKSIHDLTSVFPYYNTNEVIRDE